MGKGTGDLYIQAFCSDRMIQSGTCGVHDYWWVFDNDLTKFNTNKFYLWNNSLIRSSTNTDYALLNTPIELPNEFEITYTMRKTGSSSNWTFMCIGESGSGQSTGHHERTLNIGKLNGSAMHIRDELAGTILATEYDNANSDTNYLTKITYQNGVLSLTYNNIAISTSNFSVDLTYLLGIGISSYGLMGEFVIKKL